MADQKDQKDIDESGLNVALKLDTSGLFCPEPVMLLHNKIRDIEAGQLLKLVATGARQRSKSESIYHTIEVRDFKLVVFNVKSRVL